MQKLNKVFLFLFLFFTSSLFSEAIVNVEDLRRDGEVGFFANISGSLSLSRGNRNRDSFSLQSSIDYNLDNLETFVVVKRSEKKINKNNYDSATLAHLRLNFLFDSDPSLETFIQYSKNPFRKFNKRELLGIGARFNIGKSMKAGIGTINENEEDLNSLSDNTLRVSSYLHNEFVIEENIIFDLTKYFGPSPHAASVKDQNNFSNLTSSRLWLEASGRPGLPKCLPGQIGTCQGHVTPRDV